MVEIKSKIPDTCLSFEEWNLALSSFSKHKKILTGKPYVNIKIPKSTTIIGFVLLILSSLCLRWSITNQLTGIILLLPIAAFIGSAFMCISILLVLLEPKILIKRYNSYLNQEPFERHLIFDNLGLHYFKNGELLYEPTWDELEYCFISPKFISIYFKSTKKLLIIIKYSEENENAVLKGMEYSKRLDLVKYLKVENNTISLKNSGISKQKNKKFLFITISVCLLFLLISGFSLLKNPHKVQSLVDFPNGIISQADFAVIEDELYHFGKYSSSGNGRLLVSELDYSFGRPKKLAIYNCVSLKQGASYLYVLQSDRTLTILDTKTKEVVAEADLTKCNFKKTKVGEKVEYSLKCADNNGAYVVISDSSQDWIVNISPDGELSTIIKRISNTNDDIQYISSFGEYLICDIDSTDESFKGVYLISKNSDTLKKLSNEVGHSWYGDNTPPFIWNDYYITYNSARLYLTNLKTGETTQRNLKYMLGSSTYYYNGYLYSIASGSIGRYNLSTNQWERCSSNNKYAGTLRISGNWIVAACYAHHNGNSNKFQFANESLTFLEWTVVK